MKTEMIVKTGTEAPQSGIYWCTVCKLPARFEAGQPLPACRNKCGRGSWQLVKPDEKANS
jgi:hypothetical protein